jgi:MraZ protein
MPDARSLILGEYRRTVDDRFRLSVPTELVEAMLGSVGDCILAKERPGALSLWPAEVWKERLQNSINLVQAKIQAGRLSGRIEDVQHLGRLLSTRHCEVQLAGRGRLVIPEGFRDFLQVEAGGEVVLVGAALCVEIWQPAAWLDYLRGSMPEFGRLLDDLSA